MAAWTKNWIEVTSDGNKRKVIGSYTGSAGSTGGEVVTGLGTVQTFICQAHSTTQAYPNETFPLKNSSGTVTVVTGSNETIEFEATGY